MSVSRLVNIDGYVLYRFESSDLKLFVTFTHFLLICFIKVLREQKFDIENYPSRGTQKERNLHTHSNNVFIGHKFHL
jgi:hypothetical protein